MKESTKKILFISGIVVIVLATGLTFYLIKKNRDKKTKKLKNPNPKKILIVGDSQSAIKSSSGSASETAGIGINTPPSGRLWSGGMHSWEHSSVGALSERRRS